MAAADQTILNEFMEKKTIDESSGMKMESTVPVPAQRRNRDAAEEPSKKIDNTLSVSTIIDNSRIFFVDKDITKSEVFISNEQLSVGETNKSIAKISPLNKSMVASFIEKFNSQTSSYQTNGVNTIVTTSANINSEITKTNGLADNKSDVESVERSIQQALVGNTPELVSAKEKNEKMKNEIDCIQSDASNMTVGLKENLTECAKEKNKTYQQDVEVKVPIPAPRNLLKNRLSESGHILIEKSSCLNCENSIKSIEITKESLQTTTSISSQLEVKTNSHFVDESKHNKHINKNDCKENENNQILLQTKPTISKKPATLSDYKKADRGFVTGKIPIFEKSMSLQDRDSKLRGLRSPPEKATEFEHKLTKRQRTSSEQCLSTIKGDSETSMKKLRVAVEQLQQENAALKKLLESERSAFREQRAVLEMELRKEKAEAKRREASLESQVRAALKGQVVTAVGQTSVVSDNARVSTALETAKTTIKSLQEKLRMALEADKRKVVELRAQHDAHSTAIQQMERDVRGQTAKLLEEMKVKDREIEKLKKEGKGTQPGITKAGSKMAVAEQLHQMEGQISRLENEIQRRDDIIQSLKTSKTNKDRRTSQRQSKDNVFKDILSDVDSAVSSAPNSLSPQPSPDLWYRHQDSSQAEVEENPLEAAKKQIQELEKALSLSTAGQKQAQQKVSQLEEQLQDLREHADLLEFRCLELEDSAEKRQSLEELTDSDSGCTSPENRIKNSVSPQLRRSDSGYKSPTRSASPSKNQLRPPNPLPYTEQDILSCTENYKAIINNLHLQSIESIFENGFCNDELRDRLEAMLLRTHSENERMCLEQMLQLLWNLQAIGSSLHEEDFSMVKAKKLLENDLAKCDFDQHSKSGKIIATVSPYSQKALNKSNDLIKSVSTDEVDLANLTTLKQESKKLLFGLQESGIFEEIDWDSKSTQTECYDCVCPEPESDLATEVLRLNQIREQLEKSGAIKNKSVLDLHHTNNGVADLKQQRRRDKKKIELYESRIAFLESKLSIYESSESEREKKLAQRLQRELDLQTKVKNLELDLSKLLANYKVLEEERCEFEEAENDTRLHCQELEAEFDLLTAKLRDLDDQRSCARNEAECYRQLVEEYEYKIMTMQQKEMTNKEKAEFMEKLLPILVSYNVFSALEELSRQSGRCNSTCTAPCAMGANSQFNPILMLEYPSDSSSKDKPDAGKASTSKGKKTGKKRKGDKSTQYQNNPIAGCTDVKCKARIEELEKRELAYLETLTKGDEMWAEMEMNFKMKLKEMMENEEHLINSLNKCKSKLEDEERKVHAMEENEQIWKQERMMFMEDFKEVKKMKEELEKKNKRLENDLTESRHVMEDRDRSFESRISLLSDKANSTKRDLDDQKKLNKNMESDHKAEVSQLKKDLRRTAEQLNEYKETVRDLTDVVQTLRENLTEVRLLMTRQKRDHEENSKALLSEIKVKNDEVHLLRNSLSQLETLPSAKEELDNLAKPTFNKTAPPLTPPPPPFKQSPLSPAPPSPAPPSPPPPSLNKNNPGVSLMPAQNNTPGQNSAPPQNFTPAQNFVPVPINQNETSLNNNDQVTTFITIKAMKNPRSNSLDRADDYRPDSRNNYYAGSDDGYGGNKYPCHCNELRQSGRLPGPSYYNDGPKRRDTYDSAMGRDPKVSFKMDDCDILYKGYQGNYGMPDESDINLVNFDSAPGSSLGMYDCSRGGRSQNDRCTCSHPDSSTHDPRGRADSRYYTKGRPSVNERRSTSCCDETQNRDHVLSNRDRSVSVQQNYGNKFKPIPLLVLTKPGDLPGQKNKGWQSSSGRRSPGIELRKPRKKSDQSNTEKLHASTSFHSGEADGTVPVKKPEVPSRKPKGCAAKAMDNKRKEDGVLRVPPPHLKDDFPFENLEMSMSKLLCESMESCLDQRTYIVCQQLVGDMKGVLPLIAEEPLKKSLMNLEQPIGDSRLVNKLEAVKNSNMLQNPITPKDSPKGVRNQTKPPIEKSTFNHDTPLAGELELNSSSINVPNKSPVPAPRKNTGSAIKRYHSLTESIEKFECESLPPIMTQSDSAASYNTVTTKDLIASFNNISGVTKPEKPKSAQSQKSASQPKSIGSFVFDRVTKLTNGLSNTRIMGLKRSVSMVADSKSPPATFYADV